MESLTHPERLHATSVLSAVLLLEIRDEDHVGTNPSWLAVLIAFCQSCAYFAMFGCVLNNITDVFTSTNQFIVVKPSIWLLVGLLFYFTQLFFGKLVIFFRLDGNEPHWTAYLAFVIPQACFYVYVCVHLTLFVRAARQIQTNNTVQPPLRPPVQTRTWH